jgi:hypothetical protein
MDLETPARRVFCLSMPRNGIASIGRFFRDVGLRTVLAAPTRDHRWTAAWHAGDFEAILASPEFAHAEAFAGSPWWLPGFYRTVFHRVPCARFVLLTREPEAWFASMQAAYGAGAEDPRLHAKAFRRELEFYRRLHAGEVDDRHDARGRRLPLHGLAQHYADVYRLHNSEVMDFFGRHAPDALHWGELEDPKLWPRLARFLGTEVPIGYTCHVNAGQGVTSRSGGISSRPHGLHDPLARTS